MNDEIFKRVLSSIILFPIVISIIIYGSILLNLLLVICFCLVLYEWHMLSKTKKYYFLGIFFLLLSFYTIYKFKDLNDNYINFLFILLICISTDIGGYVFGKIFKGPKLTTISPNKTFSGAIGGYLLSLVFIIIFFQILSFFKYKTSYSYEILLFVIIISSVSQLGDILISYFKRNSNVKDTGNIIPGHGGLLDRVDGMIFAYPFSYLLYLLNFFKEF
tara:strand:+ start:132 stop:785 length:654 start_codon:yes stop_codon:yes gene_type:complete